MSAGGVSHTTGTEDRPPDKYSKVADPKISEEVREEKIEISKLAMKCTYVRHYPVNNMPPMGISFTIVEKFKSLVGLVPNTCKYKGRYMPSISAEFGEKDDFDNAKKFDLNIFGKTVVFEAIDTSVAPESVDGMTVLPRLSMNMVIERASYAMLQNPNKIVELFQDFAEVESTLIQAVKVNGVFSGKIVVPVKVFKKIPQRFMEVPEIRSNGNEIDHLKRQLFI